MAVRLEPTSFHLVPSIRFLRQPLRSSLIYCDSFASDLLVTSLSSHRFQSTPLSNPHRSPRSQTHRPPPQSGSACRESRDLRILSPLPLVGVRGRNCSSRVSRWDRWVQKPQISVLRQLPIMYSSLDLVSMTARWISALYPTLLARGQFQIGVVAPLPRRIVSASLCLTQPLLCVCFTSSLTFINPSSTTPRSFDHWKLLVLLLVGEKTAELHVSVFFIAVILDRRCKNSGLARVSLLTSSFRNLFLRRKLAYVLGHVYVFSFAHLAGKGLQILTATQLSSGELSLPGLSSSVSLNPILLASCVVDRIASITNLWRMKSPPGYFHLGKLSTGKSESTKGILYGPFPSYTMLKFSHLFVTSRLCVFTLELVLGYIETLFFLWKKPFTSSSSSGGRVYPPWSISMRDVSLPIPTLGKSLKSQLQVTRMRVFGLAVTNLLTHLRQVLNLLSIFRDDLSRYVLCISNFWCNELRMTNFLYVIA